MNNESSKLGRGLSALLSSKDSEYSESKGFKIVNVTSLRPNKEQPRKKFNKDELEQLTNSIKAKGMLQPIIVRKFDEENFEIIAGERRWRAAQMGGVHEVPVIIREVSDKEVMQIALIENIQRENLNPVEEARALQKLLQNNDSNYEELTKLIDR